MATFAESQEKALGSLRVQLRDGFLSEDEFNKQYEVILNSILDNQGKTIGMAVSSLTKNIKSSYSEEMSSLMPELNDVVLKVMNDPGNLYALKEQGALAFTGIKDGLLDGMKVDSATKEAMSQLYKELAPDMEKMNAIAESYKEAGSRDTAGVAKWITIQWCTGSGR